jgi:uncharacterized membrane protein
MAVAREPQDPELKARRQMAGRVGFIMGCIAAIVAATINFVRAPRPLSAGIALLIVLVAALNIPLGIAIGLLGERLSRRAER